LKCGCLQTRSLPRPQRFLGPKTMCLLWRRSVLSPVLCRGPRSLVGPGHALDTDANDPAFLNLNGFLKFDELMRVWPPMDRRAVRSFPYIGN
jgi:hypothetical protein